MDERRNALHDLRESLQFITLAVLLVQKLPRPEKLSYLERIQRQADRAAEAAIRLSK